MLVLTDVQEQACIQTAAAVLHFADSASLAQCTGTVPGSRQMVAQLLSDGRSSKWWTCPAVMATAAA